MSSEGYESTPTRWGKQSQTSVLNTPGEFLTESKNVVLTFIDMVPNFHIYRKRVYG